MTAPDDENLGGFVVSQRVFLVGGFISSLTDMECDKPRKKRTPMGITTLKKHTPRILISLAVATVVIIGFGTTSVLTNGFGEVPAEFTSQIQEDSLGLMLFAFGSIAGVLVLIVAGACYLLYAVLPPIGRNWLFRKQGKQ